MEGGYPGAESGEGKRMTKQELDQMKHKTFCQTCEELKTAVINLPLSNGFPSMLISSKNICIRHYTIGMLMK